MLLVAVVATHIPILVECNEREVTSQGRINLVVGVILLLAADSLLFAAYRLIQKLGRLDRLNNQTGTYIHYLGCLLTAFLLILVTIGLIAGLS